MDLKLRYENSTNEVKSSNTKAVTLRVNPWWLSAVLAVGLVAVVALWRPWDSQPSAGDRTVSVSGSATLKAEPDEYVFYPSYEFKNADKTAGLKELTAKSDEVVAGLKKGWRGRQGYKKQTRAGTEQTITITTKIAGHIHIRCRLLPQLAHGMLPKKCRTT